MMRSLFGGNRSYALKLGLALGVASLGFAACYPGEIADVAQTDLTSTIYAKEAPWGTISTVTVLDTVVHVVPEGTTDTIEISRDYDARIIQNTVSGFQAYGFSLIEPDAVTDTNQPDAFVLISMSAARNTVVWRQPNWWGYWGWYPGWPGWGPGWGWYYPPCCSYGAAQYTSGSIFVDMLDAQEAANDSVPVLWSMAVNGVVGSSAAGTENRIDTTMGWGFDQSPYLQVSQ
jgi:hypothetical protein